MLGGGEGGQNEPLSSSPVRQFPCGVFERGMVHGALLGIPYGPAQCSVEQKLSHSHTEEGAGLGADAQYSLPLHDNRCDGRGVHGASRARSGCNLYTIIIK